MIRMICYDISESKARTRLAKLLLYYGFERVQYSVFIGKVRRNNWKKCWKAIGKFYEQNCKEETDRIHTHIIERDHFEKMSILGHGPDTDWILHEILVLFV